LSEEEKKEREEWNYMMSERVRKRERDTQGGCR